MLSSYNSLIILECKNGEVRLVGGEYDNEGTVELCYNDLWGQISDSGWSVEDAKVVCRQLGYTNGGNTHYRDFISLLNINYSFSSCGCAQLKIWKI